MKEFLSLIILALCCLSYVDQVHSVGVSYLDSDPYRYKGQSGELIDWKELDIPKWIDYYEWKKERIFWDETKNWKRIKREMLLKETIGRIVGCHGTCKKFQGLKSSESKYRSTIVETDNIETSKDSYAWIYLLNGTMVRLSPETSITFMEMSFSPNSVFFSIQLHRGNILWFKRFNNKLVVHEERDTDTILFPLKIEEANVNLPDRNYYNSEDIYLSVDEEERQLAIGQYQKLNNTIEINNADIIERDEYVLLSMPNALVFSKNAIFDVVTEIGKNSLVKSRNVDEYYQMVNEQNREVKKQNVGYVELMLFEDKDKDRGVRINNNRWYRIMHDGKNYDEIDDRPDLSLGEFVTKRISTIMLAREIMFKKYSHYLLSRRISQRELAENFGIKLWDNFLDENLVMSLPGKRYLALTKFYKEEHRISLDRYLEYYKNRLTDGISDYSYDSKYYELALAQYFSRKEFFNMIDSDKEKSNQWREIDALKSSSEE